MILVQAFPAHALMPTHRQAQCVRRGEAEAGHVRLVRGLWNDAFLRVLENFPAGKDDDEVDALSGAHGVLSGEQSGAWDGAAIDQAFAATCASSDPTGMDADVESEFFSMADALG